MRKPSQAKLRLLADVGNGRARRLGSGWMLGSQPAASADARGLNDAHAAGWLHLDHEPSDPYESAPVALTAAGRDVLARYWPNWSPADD